MAKTKTLLFPYVLSGATGLYARVLQTATGLWLDWSDGTFKANPSTPHIPLTESPAGFSVYKFDDDRVVWADGKYQAFGYTSIDFLFAGGELFILNDEEVGLDVLLAYMELIKKVESNGWELKEISGQAYWVVYDDDGSTELMRFRCLDINGNPSLANIFKRVRV